MLGKIEKILAEADPGLKSVQALAEECLVRLKSMAVEVSLCSGCLVSNDAVQIIRIKALFRT